MTIGGVASVFFFQAEDGIRDYKVTGVQTCALPIWSAWRGAAGRPDIRSAATQPTVSSTSVQTVAQAAPTIDRSEERRVGKECRWRRTLQSKKKKDTERSTKV